MFLSFFIAFPVSFILFSMFFRFFTDRSETILGKDPEMILEILIKSFLFDNKIYPDSRGYLDLSSRSEDLSSYLSSKLGFNLGLIFFGPHLSLIEFHKKYPRDLILGKILVTIKNPYLDPIFIDTHRKKYDTEDLDNKIVGLYKSLQNDPKNLLKINIQV